MLTVKKNNDNAPCGALCENLFSSKQRLSDPKEFKAVFQAKKKRALPYFAVFSKINHLGYARIGFVVAKRNVRRANKRNLIRRIIRESFRLNQRILADLDIVVVVYQPYAALSKQDMRRVIDEHWKKIIDSNNTDLSNLDKSSVR